MDSKNNRMKQGRDLGYLCCSSYGKTRSIGFVQKYFKDLLKKTNLPNIRFHDLRHTYSTLLIMNDYNLKAVSSLLGHASSIITIDVYTDKTKLAIDCLEELEPFIKSVIPKQKNGQKNYTNLKKIININDFINFN